jgi:hypothetical protein
MGFLEKKVEQTKTPEEFEKLSLQKFHKLWFGYAMSNQQIADMFGVTKKDVKRKRKELGLSYFKAGMLYVYGGPKYREKTILGKDKLDPTYKEKPKKKTRAEKREDKFRGLDESKSEKPKRKTLAEKREDKFRYGDSIPDEVKDTKENKKNNKKKG